MKKPGGRQWRSGDGVKSGVAAIGGEINGRRERGSERKQQAVCGSEISIAK